MKWFDKIAISAALALGFAALPAQAAITAANSQYVAKLYTEGLGRIPDQGGWQSALNYWSANACNLNTLQGQARIYLESQEFLTSSPTNHERAFRLYRSTLHRDASAAELTNTIAQLNNGTAWPTVLTGVLNSAEFSSRVTQNCSANPFGWQAVAPTNIVQTSTGAPANETQLRAALAGASPGATVFLERGATILLTSTLQIPAGVTLATVGLPTPSQAPLLGRIARNSAFNGPMISLNDNSTIRNLWIDGQRNRFGFIGGSAMNVYTQASNATVASNIISDATAWTHLQVFHAGQTCSGGNITSNLVTAYGSTHTGSGWSDGLSIACRSVTVEGNSVIDATDVGIIVFQVYPATQASQVRNNYILNAGNSTYAGIAADPLHNGEPHMVNVPLTTLLDFTGTQFNDNLIWSSPAVHMDFVIANGTRPWFGSRAFTGRGARFYNNNSGSQTVTAYTGIAVSGMVETFVQSNSFSTRAPTGNFRNCGLRNVAVAPSPYGNDAASNIQPHIVLAIGDPIVSGCIGH